jgi:hypothetical protein
VSVFRQKISSNFSSIRRPLFFWFNRSDVIKRKIFGRRFAEKVSLNDIAVIIIEYPHLLFGLDSFSEDIETEFILFSHYPKAYEIRHGKAAL